MKKLLLFISILFLIFSCKNDKTENTITKGKSEVQNVDKNLSENEQLLLAQEAYQNAEKRLEAIKNGIYPNEHERNDAIQKAERELKQAKEFLQNLEKKFGKLANTITKPKTNTPDTLKIPKAVQNDESAMNALKKIQQKAKENREAIQEKKIESNPNKTGGTFSEPAPREM